MDNTLVEQLRQGCDCSEQVCEMDTFSEQAADRIEELEAENRIFRATESVDDTVWDALLEQIRSHQSRIEELEASTIHAKYVSAMGLIKACEPYLKDGETPAECIQRNRDDSGAVLKLLAKEKRKYEALVDRARHIIAHYDEWDDVLPNECIDQLRALLEDDDERFFQKSNGNI